MNNHIQTTSPKYNNIVKIGSGSIPLFAHQFIGVGHFVVVKIFKFEKWQYVVIPNESIGLRNLCPKLRGFGASIGGETKDIYHLCDFLQAAKVDRYYKVEIINDDDCIISDGASRIKARYIHSNEDIISELIQQLRDSIRTSRFDLAESLIDEIACGWISTERECEELYSEALGFKAEQHEPA